MGRLLPNEFTRGLGVARRNNKTIFTGESKHKLLNLWYVILLHTAAQAVCKCSSAQISDVKLAFDLTLLPRTPPYSPQHPLTNSRTAL